MSFIFKPVARVFHRQPTLANAATGFACFALGEVASQKQEGRAIDVRRAIQIGALGSLMNGVVMMKWFAYLDVVFGASMTSPRVLVGKTIADQIVYAPVGIASFFAYSCMLDQSSARPVCDSQKTSSSTAAEAAAVLSPSFIERWTTEFKQLMEASFVRTFSADCAVWPAVNLIQFRFVPLTLRPAVNGVIALAWQTFVSLESHSHSELQLKVREFC
jgi:protein Mpv17